MAELGPQKRTTAIIFLIVFLDLLGVGIIAPMSAFLVQRFDASGSAVAMLTLAYSAAQFLATPVLGVLSDKLGRRPVLLSSMFGSGIGYVMFALSNSLPLLYISRVIDGVTGGNISTAQAALADVTPPKDRAKAYGMIGAAFGLGFMLGPALAAGVSWGVEKAMGDAAKNSSLPTLAPIWVAAGLSFATTLLASILLPETHPRDKRRTAPITGRDLNPFAALLAAWLLPGIAILLSIIFMFGVAHAELRSVFSKYMLDRHGFDEPHTGMIFAFMGLVAIIVQGGLVRRIVPKIGEKRAILIGMPLAAIGYASIVMMPHGWMVYFSIVLTGLGGGLAGPPLSSLVSKRAPAEKMGAAMGASQSATSLGLVIGPLIAGELYDRAGKGWPFYSAAGILIIGWLIAMRLRSHAQEGVHAAAAEIPEG